MPKWLTDKLPTGLSRRARILTYRYSSQLFSSRSSSSSSSSWRPHGGKDSLDDKASHLDEFALRCLPQTVQIHSNVLLAQLTALRRDRDRPLIWIGHTLGGLIVKHTLVQASAAVGDNSARKAVHLATCGVLYFDTPMRDTARQPWALILAAMMSATLRGTLPPINMDKSSAAAVIFEKFDLQSQRYKSIESEFRHFSFSTRRPQTPNSARMPEEILVIDHASSRWTKARLHVEDLEMIRIPPEDFRSLIKAIEACLEDAAETRRRSSAYYSKLSTSTNPQIALSKLPASSLLHNPIPDTPKNNNQTNKRTLIPNRAEEAGELQPQRSHPEANTETLVDDPNDETETPETDLSCSSTTQSSASSSIADAKSQLRNNERHYGHVHEKTLSSLLFLAKIYESQSFFPAAELIYKRAFVAYLDSDAYGPNHPTTAKLSEHLSVLECKQGKFPEAAEHMAYLLQFQEKTYGPGDPRPLSTRAQLAVLYDKCQRWDEAEASYSHVIQSRRALGEDQTEATLKVMENLALSYRLHDMKKTLKLSKAIYKEVYYIRKAQFDRVKRKVEADADANARMRLKKLAGRPEYASLYRIVGKLLEVYESLGDHSSRRDFAREWECCLELDPGQDESEGEGEEPVGST